MTFWQGAGNSRNTEVPLKSKINPFTVYSFIFGIQIVNTRMTMPLIKSDGSILIVTVTKAEAMAVLNTFSKASGEAWSRQAIGNKTYCSLGVHGGVPVFMVQSEMGAVTPGGALLTVRQAMRDLHPQAIIMCGIAFGLRPDKQQLGDILIARQILSYESLKVDIQQGQMPRGDRTTASERLLDRFRSGDNDWQSARTHFGLILSGEKLVNAPDLRDWFLKTEPEAIGGEMEGAGLYVAARDAKVDWILVKAICDWADGSKNSEAQQSAADNAARFVLHVLQLGGWEKPEQSMLSDTNVDENTKAKVLPMKSPAFPGKPELGAEQTEKLMQHDIFVSYVRVDNKPPPGANKGWVTTLIDGLKNYLGQKLGNADAYSLWMDDELRGNGPVAPDIARQLENSAILLLILSPDYLASPWCRQEFSMFLANENKGPERVFIVERNFVQRPEELSNLLGYKFWVKDNSGHSRILATPRPNPEEFEYYQKLDDLARQLSDKIKSLRKGGSASPQPSIPPEHTVFLALVSEDLEEHRNEVKRCLEQRSIRVLPDKAYSYANIQQSLDQDLSQCRLFVQLLSEKSAQGFPRFQYERAKAAELPILQWCGKTLDLNRMLDLDPAHRDLLSQSTVIVSGLVEFQERILNRLKPQEVIKRAQTKGNHLVFINAAPEDMPLAHQVKDVLDEHGIGCSLPLAISVTAQPAEIRHDLENNLRYCDAVIVFYNNTSVVQVRERVLYCRYMQAQREQPLKIIAVYVSSSTEDKQPLGINFPNMQVLECPTPQTDTCLPVFIQHLLK